MAFLYILLLLVKVLQIGCHIDCPKVFLRFSKDHSYCKESDTSAHILRTYPTLREIDQILELHNAFRSVVATQQEQGNKNGLPAAANMMQMEWDDELAAVAQRYINRTIYAHDCPNCRRVVNFGVGQNLAIQKLTGHNLKPPTPDWSFAVGDWFQEIVFFNKEMVCPFPAPNGGGEYRHFSQLAWADTFRVGCGYIMYQQGNSFTRLYICNYGPGGNMYGSCTYKAGPPCSKCPTNTCCGESCNKFQLKRTSYPGLCRRVNEEAPLEPIPQPHLFYCDFHERTISDCLVSSEGGNVAWFIIPSLEGNFLETVLNPGQNTTLVFTKPIKPNSKLFCVQIRYRKGPNIDGNPETSTANEIFVIPTLNDYTLTQPLPSFERASRMMFTPFDMTLQWSDETYVKINFAVPYGGTPQFINIASVAAFDKPCNT